MDFYDFAPYMGVLIYATLSSVTFGSILAKRPFTLQYAPRDGGQKN